MTWREELKNKTPMKERTAIERVKMNEVAPAERIKSQTIEVNTGLTKEQAMVEAKRCMDCPNHPCTSGCPVGIDIPRFVKNIERGEFQEAAAVLKEFSALPAVCGRVCPQEKQCESQCTYLKMNKPAVAIGYLERFAADYERLNGIEPKLPKIEKKNGIKVAAVGSGPSALSFAGDMAKAGYDVTVFEALHEIGGVLKYGIPEFRLPNSIVDLELANLALWEVEDSFAITVEKSPTNLHGLTHRELGDYTDTLALLMETANASQGRLHGRIDSDLVVNGVDKFYTRADSYGAVTVPFGAEGISLSERVARFLPRVCANYTIKEIRDNIKSSKCNA